MLSKSLANFYRYCSKLGSFHATVAPSLLQLKELTVGYCLNLEHIFVYGDEEDQTSLKDYFQSSCFANLIKIVVKGLPQAKESDSCQHSSKSPATEISTY